MKARERFRLTAAGSILVTLIAGGLVAAAPASAVPGLTLVAAASPVNSASSKEVLAACPRGTRILGGGGFIAGGGRQVHLTRLQALGAGDQFVARAEENGAYFANWQVFAYGICGQAPAGLAYVTAAAGQRSSSTFKQAHATCAPGKRTISAGATVVDGNGEVVLVTFQPGQDLVTAEAHEDEDGYRGDWSVLAHAVCSDPLPGWQLVTHPTPSNSSDKVNSATCPAGKRLHGFGSAVNGGDGVPGQVIHAASYPLDVGLTTAATVAREDATGAPQNWFTSIVAICAN